MSPNATEARSRVPHRTHLREFSMPDGRKLLVDRRSIAFICEGKQEDQKDRTIIAFRIPAKPCPVTESYEGVASWWLGANGKDQSKE